MSGRLVVTFSVYDKHSCTSAISQKACNICTYQPRMCDYCCSANMRSCCSVYMAFSTEIICIGCLHSGLNVSDLSVALLPKAAALSGVSLRGHRIKLWPTDCLWDVPSLDGLACQKKEAKALDKVTVTLSRYK